MQDFRIVDVLRILVVRRERGDGRDHHAHGVCVVVESFEETLTYVFVNEGVIGHFLLPRFGLFQVGQFTV